ncbi:SWI/SNF and RSC complex subunit Ssr1 [Sorochytrium milnesiophthora]
MAADTQAAADALAQREREILEELESVVTSKAGVGRKSAGGKYQRMSDISVHHYLPNNIFKEFAIGVPADVLFTFGNNNPTRNYTVRLITAALTDPSDYTRTLKNLTALETNATVPSHEQASLQYRFLPDNVEPRTYGAVIVLHYLDQDDGYYRAVAYNDQIRLVAPAAPTLDVETVSIYVFLVVALMGTGLLVRKAFFSSPPTIRRVDSKLSEWLPQQEQSPVNTPASVRKRPQPTKRK